MRGAWGQNGLIILNSGPTRLFIIYHLYIYKSIKKRKRKRKIWLGSRKKEVKHSLSSSLALGFVLCFFSQTVWFLFLFLFTLTTSPTIFFFSLSLSSARDADPTLSLSSTQREKNIFVFYIYFSEETIVENA